MPDTTCPISRVIAIASRLLSREMAIDVTDATASPDIGHEVGLERLRNAGITLVSTKSLFFEWARDLDTCYRYVDEGELQSPAELFI